MKWPFVFACALCTAFGLLLGVLLPIDLSQPAPGGGISTPALPLEPAGSGSDGGEELPLNPEDNFSLLRAAGLACGAIGRRDFAALASFHPSALHHLDMVTRETSTFSAISVCSMPARYSDLASDFFFSVSAFVIRMNE